MFFCLESLLKVDKEERMDIQKLLRVLSEILSEKHGVEITPKDEV